MKKLKFTPIYNGIWGMTPQRYQQIQKAKAYSKMVAQKNKRKEFWKDILIQTVFGIILAAILLGLFFLLLFM